MYVTADDFTATPLSDLAIPLPPPDSNAVRVKYDANTGTFSEDERLLPVNRNLDQEDILDQNGEAGVCGLRNLGNTCFMSAGVQCLVATAPLVSSLLSSSPPHRLSLTGTIADLIRNVWSGRFTSLHPTKFRYSISTQFPQFSDFRQHDCQEFLALLLDGLHEQLNLAKKKGNPFSDNSRDLPCSSLKQNAPVEEYVPEGAEFNNYLYIPTKINETNIINDLLYDNNTKKSNIKLNPTKQKTTSDLNNSEECSSKINKICTNSVYEQMVHNNPNNDKINTIISLNNTDTAKISSLEDIVKNAKTSNVNVMVTEEEANNEIRFDSEKYPRIDIPRRRTEGRSVNTFHLYENNVHGKRGKSTLTKFATGANLKEGLDLKRVKLNSPTDEPEEKNKRMESERQQKLSDDKNKRMESERKESIKNELRNECGPSSSGTNNASEIRYENTGEPDADLHWQKHLSENRSIIVDTFQGQFKSTVVCSNCKFVSITYEPFMYLSVPLPNTMKKKFAVTFVSESLKEPIQYLLEVNKYDNVGTLKKQLLQKIDSSQHNNDVILIGEVLDHHIAKLLDDNCIIRNINDTDRTIYAFKIISTADAADSATKSEGIKGEDNLTDTRCTICLEDKHSNMNQHVGCTCILCETCITAACQHSRGTCFECPLCRRDVNPETEMVPIVNGRQFTVRSVNMPVVFRMDSTNVGNNNEKGVKLFGHPRLLRLPNRISAENLHQAVKEVVPYDKSYKLLTVDGQGSHCSRCMFNMHCRGCDIPTEGQVSLYSSDTLAVAFSAPVELANNSPTTDNAVSHSLKVRQNAISLYDCIRAFSQSELLDESNPWYCPKCLEHRCATKTLTVWRYPDYLIVYLKRFVFHNRIITKLDEKVDFPLSGLTFDTSVYDLYGVVCHVGGVTAGHYTAYTKHPYTGVWHYFNDCYVAKKIPQEEDLRNAYILFYMKQGITVPTLEIDRAQ
ncbi:ubiquitin carboxyl-terminal hydrolase 19-like isoform X3 [Rhodnius prolixus]|uniref:ubiquitin carboxyl-terminal hydrolase 19-like isoform X3 n=1 Tax=Rhodnius prolixus TaxID=13249 RepID=UPI003D18E3D6